MGAQVVSECSAVGFTKHEWKTQQVLRHSSCSENLHSIFHLVQCRSCLHLACRLELPCRHHSNIANDSSICAPSVHRFSLLKVRHLQLRPCTWHFKGTSEHLQLICWVPLCFGSSSKCHRILVGRCWTGLAPVNAIQCIYGLRLKNE